MYFRVNLKMKNPTLCCFTKIAFTELNFTVAILLIMNLLPNFQKDWLDRVSVARGGYWEGGDYLLRGFSFYIKNKAKSVFKKCFSLS